MLPPLRYIIPVHDDAATLARSVDTLVSELSARPASERHDVLLVENGSRDDSFRVAEALAGERQGVRILAFQEPRAGLGFAYDRGIREALRLGGERRWLVLSASDLPFGFTDLDAFERWLGGKPSVRMAIGSKFHSQSEIPGRGFRDVVSLAYRAARRALLRMRTTDSQGSFFVREDFAAELAPRVLTRDFFYTTELAYYAERSGEAPHELPVRLGAEIRGSTVRPFKHGAAMFLALLALRRRSR